MQLARGGFPEPFLSETLIDANRWRLQYVDSLLREDILDFENIQNVKAIRLMFELLRERVGSPISYSSIAEDIAISPTTVKKYIQILEALYIVFRVTPFSHNIARSLLKEPKIYFFDTGLVKGRPRHYKRLSRRKLRSALFTDKRQKRSRFCTRRRKSSKLNFPILHCIRVFAIFTRNTDILLSIWSKRSKNRIKHME